MEGEVDFGLENAQIVLDEEYPELLHILTHQPSTTLNELCALPMTSSAGLVNTISPTSSPAAMAKYLLDYYTSADSSVCRDFLQRICMLCENIPMWLESRLMSVSGSPTNVRDIYRLHATRSLEQHIIKRPRIDPWEQFITSVKGLLRMRWEAMRKRLVMEVELDQVWVSVKRANRSRDPPDQTPGSGDGGSRTPDLDVECGFPEARVTLDTFLQGSIGKVTILHGKPGSGKTLHMSRLGELWACDLGHIPSSHIFILLEFRHLNLLSQNLSFYDLLFQYYPSPQGGENEKIAIVDYLLSNPEQSCWVLDGYDEFQSNLYKRDYNNAQLDPRSPRPVAELIAALLHRHILPGCTVVFTCRVRDVTDLERKAEKVGELLPWNHHKIKEYVDKYFQHKGNLAVGKHATKLLFSNKHLVAMSSIPALCNISCICLEYFLQETQQRGEDKADLKKHKEDVESILQIPSTLTGVYLTSIGTFLSHLNKAKSPEVTLSSSTNLPLTSLVSNYKSELTELFELAWNGLETGKIVFLEEEIPHRILHFSVMAGFISETELRQNGILVTMYCFAHLTVQEFLSALKIMTSVDDKELRNRLSLKTRWPSKSGQKTVFTNSLHRFLSGLASPHCSAVLALLTKADHSFVHKRQETVKKWLQQMCHTQMTGPKVLELCHCIQESQDKQISKQLMSVKPKLELHNITLSPNDLDALAFVVNSSEERNIALDFRACSIELDGLELLSQCNTITNLSFHGRKYEDSFAEKLSTILPKLSSLKKLSVCDARMSAIGAARLASALVECPCITEINFSGNNLRDDGTKHITDILPKLPQLSFVNLGQNNTSLQAAVYLTKEIASMNVQRIYIDGNTEELKVTFDPNQDRNSDKADSHVEISLLKQKWNKSEMQKLAQSLTQYPSVSVLNLSGQLKIETLKVLVQFLPKFHITEKITLKGCCSSLEAVIVLTSFMSQCTTVSEINIRRKSPSEAVIVFHAGSVSKSLRVNNSSFKPGDVTALCNKLILCHAFLELDLSHSPLKDGTIQNLVEVLPKMTSLKTLKLNGCIVSTNGALILVKGLTGCERVKSVQLSLQRESSVTFDETKPGHFSCRFSYFSLDRDSLGELLEALQSRPQLSELDLSSNKLDDKDVKYFLNFLPGLKVNNYINLSNNELKQQGMLDVANTLSTRDSVSAVEVCLAEDPKCIIWFKQSKKQEKYLRVTGATLTPNHQKHLVQIMSSCQLPVKLEIKNCFSNSVEEFVELFDSSCAGCTINIEESWIRSEEGVRLLCHCLELNRNINSIRIHQTTLSLTLENSNRPIQYSTCADTSHPKSTSTGNISNILSLLHLSVVNCETEGRHLALMKDILDRCVHLTELDLSDNHLGEIGAEFLCSVIPSLPKLVSLRVDNDRCEHFAEILCKSLLQCKDLHYLSLSGYVISETAAQMIASVLPRLKSINLSHCSWSNSGGVRLIRSLGHCEHLEELCLNCVQLDQESKMCLVQSLPRAKTLRRLELRNVSTSSGVFDVFIAVKELVHLEVLEMNNWKMLDNEVELLVKLFPLWTHLQKICLSQTFNNDQSGDKLLEVLENCTFLKELHISRNNLSDLTAARMALVFPSLIHLCEIDISENKIGPKGSMDLAKAISSLKNLIKINLTSVGTSELCAAVASMANCPQIQDVRMGWNSCDDDVAHALVRVLHVCQSLEKIDLECNHVSLVGAEALLEALQSCPALQIIRLWKNRVSLADAERLTSKDRRLTFSST